MSKPLIYSTSWCARASSKMQWPSLSLTDLYNWVSNKTMKDGVCDALILITLHPLFLLNKLKLIPRTPTSKKKWYSYSIGRSEFKYKWGTTDNEIKFINYLMDLEYIVAPSSTYNNNKDFLLPFCSIIIRILPRVLLYQWWFSIRSARVIFPQFPVSSLSNLSQICIMSFSDTFPISLSL